MFPHLTPRVDNSTDSSQGQPAMPPLFLPAHIPKSVFFSLLDITLSLSDSLPF